MSYTDAAVEYEGDYFVNRIAVRQDVATPADIKIYRIRRQWGQNYTGVWPPNFTAPGGATNSCDGVFFENQPYADARWQDCLNRGQNVLPNTGGVALTQAADWTTFESNYNKLLAGTTTVTDFISSQTYYYDTTNKLLYFYMIENNPVNQQPSPYGTCGGGKTTYASNIKSIQNIKKFSDQGSIQAALDAACLVVNKTPQATDLFSCSEAGCVAYAVDFTESSVVKSAPASEMQVVISGVKGNSEANGTWSVTQTSGNTFILNGSSGNSDYTSGGTWQSVLSSISNASPNITIASAQPAPSTGTSVVIAGVKGNTAANNSANNTAWVVTNTGNNTFTLNSSVGNAAYTGGGTWQSVEAKITLASKQTPIIITTSQPAPPTGTKVIISGIKGNTAANGSWVVTNMGSDSFALNSSVGNAAYTSGGTWQTVAAPITNASPNITISSTHVAPLTGMKVTISGVKGNTSANGRWTVTNTGKNTFMLDSSIGNATYISGGTWQTQPANIAYATNSTPIVVGSEAPCTNCVPTHPITPGDYSKVNQYQLAYSTPTQQPNGLPVVGNISAGNALPPRIMAITNASKSTPITITTQNAPTTGAVVIISGVKGNTAANGTWTVTKTGKHTFTLNASVGNATYTSGGKWQPVLVAKHPQNDKSPSEGGNQIIYSFLPLSGAPVPLTQDFPYQCAITPPWSPVNARGTYPADDEKFPLVKNICELDK